MAKKSFSEKLNNAKDLPRVEFVDPDSKMAKLFGSERLKGKRYFVKDYKKFLFDFSIK